MNIYPEYEYRCSKCDGSGVYYDRDDGEVYRCATCSGTGAILTRQGKLLIEFIERHIKIME